MKKVYLMLVLLVPSVVFSQHFVKGNISAGSEPMNIRIVNADIGGVALETGDEIAVFDGNLCCGVVTLTQSIVLGNETTYAILDAANDDGSGNGFVQTHKMYFRFWDSSAGIEYHNVIPIVKDNTNTDVNNEFLTNVTVFVNASTASTTLTWVGGNAAGGAQNWSNINNWNPKNIPEPLHSVIIPNIIASRHPIIFAGTNASAGSLNIVNSNTVLTIWSDDNGDGSLVVANGISGATNVTGMRYMSTNAWHMVSSPVSGESVSDFLTNNSAIPTKNSDLRGLMTYNESIDDWNDLFTNSSGGNVDLGMGYCVRIEDQGDPTLNNVFYNGSLSSGDVTVSVSKTASPGNGWNLIGNPYPSAIYARQEVFGFLVANNSMLDNSFKGIYLWDPVANKYSAVGMDEGDPNLALGQGFFIKAASSGNVIFTKQMQVHQTNAAFKSATILRPSIVLNARANDISSSTKISFNEEMTLGLDPGYDLGILRSGLGFDIYSKLVTDNGVDFMVQSLPGKSSDSYVIPVGVDAAKGGEIVFSANSLNLPVGYQLVLEDKLTNSFSDLKNGEIYVANLSSNARGTGRFYLHVGSSLQTGIQEIQKDELFVYTIDNTVYIKGEVSNNAQFVVYSIDGRLINRFGATSQNLNQMSTAGYTPGIYFINVLDKIKYKPVKFVIGN